MSQRDRRREPYPWTWEPAAAIATILLAVATTATQLGRAAATWMEDGGAHFPSTATGWVTSTPAVLAGNAAAGLPPVVGSTTSTAGPVLLGCCIAVTGLLLLGLTVTACVVGWRRWGPGGMQGVAGPGEVRATLGLRRLRRNGRLIRPDLYQRRTGGGG